MIGIDLQTFRQSCEGGNVTGVIFLELSDGAYPGRGWSDFPVIILCWWIDALLELDVATRRKVQWRFMDGSESVTLRMAGSDDLTDAFELSQVHSALLEVAERVVAYCDEHRMFSKDLDLLRMNVGRLKANQTVPRMGSTYSVRVAIRP